MQIKSKAELDAAIIELEKRKLLQERMLIDQFHSTRESLSPVNLIKDGFNKLTQMPGIGDGLLNTAAGVGVAFLSKKLLIGNSSSIIKKALAGIVEFAVAKSTINHADKIKAFGISIYNNLFRKKHSNEDLQNDSIARGNGTSQRSREESGNNSNIL